MEYTTPQSGHEIIQQGTVDDPEIVSKPPDIDHKVTMKRTLRDFSNLPHSIKSHVLCLEEGCKVAWKVDTDICRKEQESKFIDVQVKLVRVDSEKVTVGAEISIDLRNNQKETIYYCSCTAVFSSKSLTTSTQISASLREEIFSSLPEDKFSIKIVLIAKDCCSPISVIDDIQSTNSSTYDSDEPLNIFRSDFITAYRNDLLKDVCLIVGKYKFTANKFVLCARSPVFNNIFGKDTSETQIVHVMDTTGNYKEAMEPFIWYLYTGLINELPPVTCCCLYLLAADYQVHTLQSACGLILLSKISVENVCTTLIASHLKVDTLLKDAAMRFIFDKYAEVIRTRDWVYLTENYSSLVTELQNFRAVQCQPEG